MKLVNELQFKLKQAENENEMLSSKITKMKSKENQIESK